MIEIIMFMFLSQAYGQDFDPCLVNNDPFQELCDKIKVNETLNILLERVQEYNNMTDEQLQAYCITQYDSTEFEECMTR